MQYFCMFFLAAVARFSRTFFFQRCRFGSKSIDILECMLFRYSKKSLVSEKASLWIYEAQTSYVWMCMGKRVMAIRQPGNFEVKGNLG